MDITNADKQALLNGTVTIPFKINIIKDGEIIKTLNENSIVSLEYEDFKYVDTQTICIGQFVARKITGELDQIYTEFEIEDTELELQMGVSYNNTTTYYSLGNFLVVKPTTDDVKEKTHFEALDYTKKFNQIFDATGLNFPCTALDLAEHVCTQCGVELATDDFTNYDFVITDDQYVENDTCRKVMQDIGKLAYSWVRIDTDNKCYIDFEVKNTVGTYDTIDNTQYYDLSLQKEVFGPVNRVVIGIKDVEGENAVIEDSQSIAEYGVTEIQLYDNNLTYTPELRQQVISSATRLFGLTYLPLEANTIGHPWLMGNDKIEIVDMNNNSLYTYPWDRTISYNGHIKTKLTSKADTKTETEYKNYGGLESAMKQTRIIVDKQNQKIEAIAEEVKPISDTVTGKGSITLHNAYAGTLHRLEIKGNISSLFPSETLYPSEDLVPLGAILKVDDFSYPLGFARLRYINNNIHDLYVYEDGKQWIERNVGVDEHGIMYELPDAEKYIEELENIVLTVSSSSIITLDGFPNATLTSTYLLENEYTDTFAPSVDLVAKINLTPGVAEIDARKISLTGKDINLTSDDITINSKYFKVDKYGNMECTSAKLQGTLKNYDRTSGKLAIEIYNTNLNFYDWKGEGIKVGTICSTRGNTDNVPGIAMCATEGSRIVWGYRGSDDTSIWSLIRYDTSDLTKTPWIKNTSTGTIFSSAGGIVVENGLIKSWNMNGANGTLYLHGGDGYADPIVVIKNGLIVDWHY